MHVILQRFRLMFWIGLGLSVFSLNSCNSNIKKTTKPQYEAQNPSFMDSLTSEEAIEAFLQTNKLFEEFRLKPIQSFERNLKSDSITKLIADSLGIYTSFFKSDFDNNGYTDLTVIGNNNDCFSKDGSCSFNVLAVMNYGRDSLQFIPIRYGIMASFVPEVITQSKPQLLVLHHPTILNWQNKPYAKANNDTLFYFEGDFIEYHKKVVYHRIEKIEFTTGPCFGSCPVFSLTLQPKGLSLFTPEANNFKKHQWNEKKQGSYTTILNTQDWQKITKLLNLLNFTELKAQYSENWTDAQSTTLKITYDNNKTKIIKDYGLEGTFGLKKVYDLLFAIRFNQEWKKTLNSTN